MQEITCRGPVHDSYKSDEVDGGIEPFQCLAEQLRIHPDTGPVSERIGSQLCDSLQSAVLGNLALDGTSKRGSVRLPEHVLLARLLACRNDHGQYGQGKPQEKDRQPRPGRIQDARNDSPSGAILPNRSAVIAVATVCLNS